jgi:lysophospholipid acyltransferase (LPLAT)-like uncharacterized protein
MADENSISEIPASSKKLKKSGVIVPHSPKWHQRLAAFLIWLVVSAVSATIRYRIRDPHGFLQRKDFGQAIFCLWHNRLALCVKIYFKFRRRQFAPPGLAGLVSASRDGALLATIFQCFGVQPVRGSSSRRGPQALLELTTWAERGYDLAITPDGPRGPRYIVQDGVMSLAQITGLPVVPFSYCLKWKIQLKSWDGFQIPLPFSICEVTAGNIFNVPREISDSAREELRKQLEAELRAISQD